MSGIDDFFASARLRHSIYLNRQAGRPGPWTDDPAYRRFKFCNVFRELDRTTTWFRENVRDRVSDLPEAILATACFRWFNRIETGISIFSDGDHTPWTHPYQSWIHTGNTMPMYHAIKARQGTGPYVTSAYIIKTHDGMPKLDGVLWALQNFRQSQRKLGNYLVNPMEAGKILLQPEERGQWSLEDVHKYLMDFPYIGAFMAYEIVSDLRWTKMLDAAPDINTWANPGPGAKRGLGRIYANDPERSVSRGRMLAEMQALLLCSRDDNNWPHLWTKWEMREVEHQLCEFDKYKRIHLGEGRTRMNFVPYAEPPA